MYYEKSWILITAAVLLVTGIVLQLTIGNMFSAGDYSFNYFAAGDFACGVFAAGIFSIGIFNIGLFAVGLFIMGWKKRYPSCFTPTTKQA